MIRYPTLLRALPFLLLVATDVSAQTFYVDGANPSSSDANPGTEESPYRTIAGAMAVHAGPGVTIRVKPAVYPEWIEVKKSGTPANPFVIEAAGDGAEVRGAYLSGRSYLVVDGFVIRGQVRFGSSRGTVLSNNRIFAASTDKAIYATSSTELKIVSNTICESAYDGIVFRDTYQCLIEDNDICRNANKGLVLNPLNNGSWGNVIRRNRFYDNGSSAIAMDILAYDNVTIQNLMWGNQHGIQHHSSFRNRHLNDVIWGNRNDGIWFLDRVREITIANCIIGDNGVGNSSAFNLYVDSLSTAPESNDNIWWYSSGQPQFKVGPEVYPSLAAWTAATSQDTRSFEENPRFRDAESQDFHLTQRSPAIDAANTSAPGWPETDAVGQGPLDDPRISNTGLGPIPYADRGAFEFVPSTLAVETTLATSLELSSMAPNPVRGTGHVEYALADPAHVRLTVMDLQGRTVATLDEGARPPGRHVASWNALGARGRMNPGLYFIRLEAGDRSVAKRFALVR